jgi:hypothetical protein
MPSFRPDVHKCDFRTTILMPARAPQLATPYYPSAARNRSTTPVTHTHTHTRSGPRRCPIHTETRRVFTCTARLLEDATPRTWPAAPWACLISRGGGASDWVHAAPLPHHARLSPSFPPPTPLIWHLDGGLGGGGDAAAHQGRGDVRQGGQMRAFLCLRERVMQRGEHKT